MKYLDYITDFGDLNITYDSTNLISVVRYLKIRRIFDTYVNIRKEKNEAIRNQQYEKAAFLRDKEKEEIEILNCKLE